MGFSANIGSDSFSGSKDLLKSTDDIYPNISFIYMPESSEHQIPIHMKSAWSGNKIELDIQYDRDTNIISGDSSGRGGEYIKYYDAEGSYMEYIINSSNRRPVVKIDKLYFRQEVATFNFDASGTYDPDGDTLKFRWDFNCNGTWDTSWSTNPIVSHTWKDDHSGTVYVQVSDGFYEVTESTMVIVTNVPPSPDAGPDHTIVEGSIISFHGSFTDPGVLDTHTIEWDFGDGTTVSGTLDPTHLYTNIGEYTVRLIVEDDDNGTGIAHCHVKVRLAAIHADEELVIGNYSQVNVPVRIVSNGNTHFKTDVVVNADVNVNGNIELSSRDLINGDLTVLGTISKQDGV